jgi:hypothetical protein
MKLPNLTAVRRKEVKTQADLDGMARVAAQHGFDMSQQGDISQELGEYTGEYVQVADYANCIQDIYTLGDGKVVSLSEFMSFDRGVEVNQLKAKIAQDYLQECIEVQKQRGQEYDKSGKGERSFSAAARAFNAVRGKGLTGSDVCLLLTMVKIVRQNSSPDRLHEDSLLDGVSYLSLWAEELNKELL